MAAFSRKMNLYRSLDELPDSLRGGAVAIGNFDGVHRGHAHLVQRLMAMAQERGGPAVVFTFDPHPARLLRPEAAPMPLIWTERKVQILEEFGVDAILVYPTTRAFLDLQAREFFEEVICNRLGARAMVEGPNFFFGWHRSGTVETLRQYCAKAGMRLEVAPPVEVQGQIVSSSRIRQLLLEGRVEEAAQMLGRPHRLRGKVARGAGRGAQLGYPTANLTGYDTLLPPEGIYAGRAWAQAQAHVAAISLGANPTFDETAFKVEAHLLDFHGDLYNQSLEVDVVARLRETVKFTSAEALIDQMACDVKAVRHIVAEYNAKESLRIPV